MDIRPHVAKIEALIDEFAELDEKSNLELLEEMIDRATTARDIAQDGGEEEEDSEEDDEDDEDEDEDDKDD